MPPVRRSANIAAKDTKQSTKYWLMKSEPETRMVKGKDVSFGVTDLQAMGNSTSQWDGVRNYRARNYMRDEMKLGDKVFFYHSNCKFPGIAGIATVVREGYPDYTAFDPEHPYYDPKSSKESPKWFMVDIKLDKILDRVLPLSELKQYKELQEMVLIKQGRLSVQPVRESEYNFIMALL